MITNAAYWVRAASLCERLKCLPWPGSLWDQSPYVLNRIEVALSAIDDVIETKAKADNGNNS